MPDLLSRSVPVLEAVGIGRTPKQAPLTKDKWYSRMLINARRSPLKYINWRVPDEKLYKYVEQDYPNLCQATDFWKLVVPKEERNSLMVEAHEPPTSGHLGVYKTYSRLAQHYYWPKMRRDVSNFVKKCVPCAAHKVDQQGKKI